MSRVCSYPEALWGPLTPRRSFCRKIVSKTMRKAQSTHQDASSIMRTESERERVSGAAACAFLPVTCSALRAVPAGQCIHVDLGASLSRFE